MGVLVYEMITGRKPFEAPHAEALIHMIMQTDPLLMSHWRPDLPTKWEKIVRRALAKNIYERYQQIDDLLEDVKAATPVHSPAVPPPAERPAAARSGTPAESKLGMAYVLFMDLAGYSTLIMDQQAEIIEELTKVVQSTQPFKRSKEADQLILLPTGDGMALVFFDDPVVPVVCGVEISRALRSRPKLKFRMGIHSGPV